MENNEVKNKKVYLQTYGCQMNEYDTELIRSILSKNGFHFTNDVLDAEVILLNTCSVRENANRKIFELIHKIRHDRGGRPAVFGILGCMATNLREALVNDEHLNLDLVAGPDSYRKLPALIAQAQEKKSWDIEVSATETYEDIYPNRESSVNAWIAIMRGCNNFCSFCVVPYARGRERSRSAASILNETKRLIADGFSQVTLLGQNVNSYHHQDTTFPKLLKQVCDCKGLKRAWFTSPHPKDVADELIDLFARHPVLCKHIHLPLQAGNNEILRKMNRPYTREHYLALVDKLRARCSAIAITTDIIVGFPGETDAQFKDTVDVYRRVEFDSAFIFKYSPRPQTKAARDFADDVAEKAKTERIVLLNQLQQEFSLKKNQALIGTRQEILIDAVRADEIEGRTIQNKRVVLKGAPVHQGPRAPDRQDTRHKTPDTRVQEQLVSGVRCQVSQKTGALGSILTVTITGATPHLLTGAIDAD